MRFVTAICVLICLVIACFGVRLAIEKQEQVLGFSERTTAVVLEKRLERIERPAERRTVGRPSNRLPRFAYEPVIKFRYTVDGREFTSIDVFPGKFRVGGNLGYFAAGAILDRFQVREEVPAYYKAENPAEACLIRRPSHLLYLVILLPWMAASGLIAFLWRSPNPTDIKFKQRKDGWIAAIWYLVGLASAGHYFYVAGRDCAGSAVAQFGTYAQLGLIPLAFALPPSASSKFARRIKGAIGFSFVGTVIGFFLGLLLGWLSRQFFATNPTTFFLCWGYTQAISIAAVTALALIGRAEATGEFAPQPVQEIQREPVLQTDRLLAQASSAGRVPYKIDERAMPSGEDVENLLPARVGAYHRESVEVPEDLGTSSIYAQYRSDSAEVFVELGICGDSASAQRAIQTAKAETDAEFSDAPKQCSLDSEPSFLKANTRRGAFMAWTRGGYYFSAHTRAGEEVLDQFMEAFPY
jgi:hypothetical protein